MNSAVPSAPPALHLSWAEVSEAGGRDSNQDRLGAARHGALSCFVLADGAGGHQDGAVAARLVVDAVLAAFCAAPGAGSDDLRAYAAAASAAVASAAQSGPSAGQRSDMSATLALLVIDQSSASAAWAHLGDSRLYLLRDNAVQAATLDHSLARQLRGADRHLLLAAIGAEQGHAVSVNAGVPLLPGDALLLCSDGLWEWLDDEAMLAAIPTSGRSEDWLTTLCAMSARAADASQPGVRDNYSAYAIRVHAEAP